MKQISQQRKTNRLARTHYKLNLNVSHLGYGEKKV